MKKQADSVEEDYRKWRRTFSFTRLSEGEVDDNTITILRRWAHTTGTRAKEFGFTLRQLSGGNAPREKKDWLV